MKKECSDEELKVGIAAILMTTLFEFNVYESPYIGDETAENMLNLLIYEKILERFFKDENKIFARNMQKRQQRRNR